MSDRDRDELAKLIHDHFCGCDDPRCSDFGGASYDAASDIRDLGYRRTVTPEQILRATRKLGTVSAIVTSLATDAANALKEIDNIRAGLVPEDGEQ